ncbi:MAG: HEAT repeat domain-containing protein [Spirochaetaceae bacterium]|jgi:HEAT repeat protein|nr:HEAT repeat domain-containing protein [Spirochaetaceae bacterium]
MTRSVLIGLFLAGTLVFCTYLTAAEGEEGAVTADERTEKSSEEQRRDTIRYGTDNEIASLIQTLKTEEAYYLDEELIRLAAVSSNRSILSALFPFFGERAREGLEERALRAISLRDDEANETILAAVDYLGNVKAGDAVAVLEKLLDGEERRFMNAAIRSLGRIGGGNPDRADGIAERLIDYYTNRAGDDENHREIIVALGETGSRAGIPFLTEIAASNDAGAGIRMAALNALSKIGDPEGLKVIVDSVSSRDPNIRSTAVSALGPFNSPETDQAILDAFRDTYYRTRLAAAQAAGKRKMEAAVPYLSYRAERDDVLQVKDEAIRALGAIGNAEAIRVLNTLFSERKNADRVRILSAEMLIQRAPDRYATRVIAELDEAKRKNQVPLYNGLLRAISTAKTRAVEDLVKRFFALGGVIEKSYALDMTANNRFKDLTEQVEALTDEKNGSLSRKAKTTLERLEQDPEPVPPPPDAPPGGSSRPAESSSPQASAAESPGMETSTIPPSSEDEPTGEEPEESSSTPADSPN